MNDSTPLLEHEKLAVERARIRAEFWGKVIVSGAVAVVAAAISTFGTVYVASLQNQASDQMARLETQVDILRSFQEQALSADIAQRVRFAHFFSKLSPSEEDRILWSTYYEDLVATYRDMIEQALSEGDGAPTSALMDTGNVPVPQRSGTTSFDQLSPNMFGTGCVDPRTGTPGWLCPAN